jgi:uncharacterized membrane protein
MSEKQEAYPTKGVTAKPEATQPAGTKPPPAQLPNDPAADAKLREKIEAAIGSAIGTPETRGQVVDRVVRVVTSEVFTGPLPHPRHLQAYEAICPGLADLIVAMAEKAHSKQEDRIDRAMKYEYDDRRLGLFLGFFALLALLISGTFICMAWKCGGRRRVVRSRRNRHRYWDLCSGTPPTG